MVVPSRNRGLLITAPNVSVDLNGFSLLGWGVAFAGAEIKAPGARLQNGTVTGFHIGVLALDGVELSVADLRVVRSVSFGLGAGDYARVVNSIIIDNGADGVSCGASCHVEGSTISENTGYGIAMESGTVLGNTIVNNASVGIKAYGSSPLFVGYGNNTILGNNTANDFGPSEVFGNLVPLQPNACGRCP